jgi:hypothetical protein
MEFSIKVVEKSFFGTTKWSQRYLRMSDECLSIWKQSSGDELDRGECVEQAQVLFRDIVQVMCADLKKDRGDMMATLFPFSYRSEEHVQFLVRVVIQRRNDENNHARNHDYDDYSEQQEQEISAATTAAAAAAPKSKLSFANFANLKSSSSSSASAPNDDTKVYYFCTPSDEDMRALASSIEAIKSGKLMARGKEKDQAEPVVQLSSLESDDDQEKEQDEPVVQLSSVESDDDEEQQPRRTKSDEDGREKKRLAAALMEAEPREPAVEVATTTATTTTATSPSTSVDGKMYDSEPEQSPKSRRSLERTRLSRTMMAASMGTLVRPDASEIVPRRRTVPAQWQNESPVSREGYSLEAGLWLREGEGLHRLATEPPHEPAQGDGDDRLIEVHAYWQQREERFRSLLRNEQRKHFYALVIGVKYELLALGRVSASTTNMLQAEQLYERALSENMLPYRWRDWILGVAEAEERRNHKNRIAYSSLPAILRTSSSKRTRRSLFGGSSEKRLPVIAFAIGGGSTSSSSTAASRLPIAQSMPNVHNKARNSRLASLSGRYYHMCEHECQQCEQCRRALSMAVDLPPA